MKVSEWIAKYIAEQGIEDVFLLSGGGMMYMLDALGSNKDLNLHFHNHEQDAGIAAEAYARISGNVGVCFATSGPGGLNAVEAIAECWVDSVPVVFFVGQNKRSQTTRSSGIEGLRQYGASEIDIIPVTKSITKASYYLDDPATIMGTVMDAFSLTTSGRPGPVVIHVPLDIQNADIPSGKETLEKILPLWEESKRPLFLLGQGLDYFLTDDVIDYARDKGIPIVTTQAGKDQIPYAHPNFIGHVGIKGDRAGNTAVQSADVILCLGASLHVFTTGYDFKSFAPEAKIIYVEPDASLRKRCEIPGAIILHHNPDWIIENIEDVPCDGIDAQWLPSLREMKQDLPVYAEDHKSEPGRMNIYRALDVINAWSLPGDIIISDAGSSFYAVGQAWQIKENQRYISSNGLGTMGWALPAATGAWNANKQRVLCFTGDGSFATGLTELAVLAKEKADVIVFVFNNDGYVSIRNTQDSFFEGRYVGTDEKHGVPRTPIPALCMSYGIEFFEVSDILELDHALKLRERGLTVMNIRTNIHQEIIPSVQTFKTASGALISGDLGSMYPSLES